MDTVLHIGIMSAIGVIWVPTYLEAPCFYDPSKGLEEFFEEVLSVMSWEKDNTLQEILNQPVQRYLECCDEDDVAPVDSDMDDEPMSCYDEDLIADDQLDELALRRDALATRKDKKFTSVPLGLALC